MVLGVMSLLMGLLIPSVGVVREKAQRMATGQKLRQIGLAVATYHSATGRSLSAEDLAGWMRRLAEETGIRESKLYLFEEDPMVASLAEAPPPVLFERASSGQWAGVDRLEELPVGIAVASGVSPLSSPSTTPIAWTRGLGSDGRWEGFGSARAGVYGGEGGFIVFLDGHVEFHRDLGRDGGQLIRWGDGGRTADIREAIGPGTVVYDFQGRVF